MTHVEALAALAGHPHAWRFRQLCEDDSRPERRDAYRAHVVRLACGEPAGAATIPLAESISLVRRTNTCPFRSTGPGCGCGARCALRRGATVSHRDCFACLERYPDA